MKRLLHHIFSFAALLFCMQGLGQQVHLKNRIFTPEKNIGSYDFGKLAARNSQFGGKSFVVIQFSSTTTEADKQLLSNAGISLQQYIPDNAFTATITGTANANLLEKVNAVAVFELEVADKVSSRMQNNNIPYWAIKEENKVDVIVHFNGDISPLLVKDYFLSEGYSVVDDSWKNYHFITLRTDRSKIQQLAAISFVEYIEPAAPDPKTFNYAMRANTRANVLNADVSNGGEGLKGKGVTIGIGDDADPASHVDLNDRIIDHAAGILNTHGTHVTGIAAGGGIKDPLYQGVAPLATVVSQLFNGIFLNAAAYISDYHMMVTNNSWGNITGECDMTGVYDTYSKLMDDISIQYPYLLNVFAAGNDGRLTCNPFPLQYHSVVSGHQSAKNPLSVGWSEKNQTVSFASSIGPTADGRIKPEITSQGSGLRSTAPNNDYFTDWGTSMAAPTVAGGAALLIEKYRQLNGGTDPKSGLLKAILMNGARDIENPAPDYKSGYGYLHLIRSLDILKNNRFFSGSVTNGGTNNQTITVPAGASQLKVLVYWHDPSAAIFAQNSLVNDIDLELTTPSGSTILPWTLNAAGNAVTQNATRGTDHINNSEQVTIDNPVAGNYTIKIKGTAINVGASQEYFVAYDFVPTGIDLTYPSSGEPFIPGEVATVNWDNWGGPQNTFTLQLSTDNGNNWVTIDNNIPSTDRQYNWTVPSVNTENAKMRLLKNSSSFSDESQPFVIVAQPTVSLASVQCEDYINITWNAVSGATDYEVMMKKGVEMVPVATTTNTSYIFSGLNRDSTYWVTVRPRITGKPGRRSVAVNRKPDNGSCAGNISDNNLKIDSIVSPSTGRKFTSSEIITTNLVIKIKNLDDAPVTGFDVKYSINGSPFITNTVSATIPANGTYLHTFTGLNFSVAGDYNIVAIVKNINPDLNTANDTARKKISQLPNSSITLPYAENFDASPPFEVIKDTIGLPDLDKWDFINSTDLGRVRSFVNTGIAKSGNRAITLDVWRYIASGNTNYLIGTFNLSNYSTTPAADLGLLLEFSYKHHGQLPHPDNRVWARRSDTDPWIQVFNFDSIPLHPGEWRTVSIPLSKTAAAISPSSSFQLRFDQHGSLAMGDDISNAGITIDDIQLSASPNDVSLNSIDAPIIHFCGSNNTVPLQVNYRISKASAGCIPIKYQLDGGNIISECASSTADTYTFNSKLDLSIPGPHTLIVWVDEPTDNYKKNDTLRSNMYVSPVISTFPYNENFENGPANWHAEGYKNSWQFGTPSSYKINKAASGTKAWKTTLRGQYNENELSYLYSPCFDISSLASPYLSFNMAMDMEQCGQFICDKTWVEYSADGITWIKLGAYGQGVNWYNRPTENVWDSANFTTWHFTGISLPVGLNNLRLRWVLSSDAGTTREGVAIDDVQIFDKQLNTTDLPWRLYPNLVSGATHLFTTNNAGKEISVQLFNSAGQLVMQQRFISGGFLDNTALDLSRFAKGVYALHVSDGTNTKVFRLVKL